MLAAAAFHAAVAATTGARLPREDRPCSGCAWKRTPDALFPPAPALPETPPKLGCWSAPSLLAGERPRAALTCEGYADPNTPACVLSLAVACVRLFAAPVEAGYVTSSALLSRPPSHRQHRRKFFSVVFSRAEAALGVALHRARRARPEPQPTMQLPSAARSRERCSRQQTSSQHIEPA